MAGTELQEHSGQLWHQMARCGSSPADTPGAQEMSPSWTGPVLKNTLEVKLLVTCQGC